MPEELRKKWYFSFMFRQQDVRDKYVTATGTYNEARAKMIASYGIEWAFQYASAEEIGVDLFSLELLEDLG